MGFADTPQTANIGQNGGHVMSVILKFVNHFSYGGIFILLILGAFGLPFPEDAILILCGFLIAWHIIMAVPTLLVVYTALLLADFILFYFGKKYGSMIVTHKKFRRIISAEKLSLLKKKFDKWGVLFIIFGRHIIILRAQLLITAGVMRMRMVKFLITDAITIPVSMLIMIGIGYIGSNSLRTMKMDITRIEYFGILLIIFLFVLYLLIKSFKSGALRGKRFLPGPISRKKRNE
jgi:membrane protein DedA with SNARE-associated domain